MSNINAGVAYNTSVPCRSLDAYSVSLGDTDKPCSNALESSSATFNNCVHYNGVFKTVADATKAIISYVGAPCMLVEELNMGIHAGYRLVPYGWKTNIKCPGDTYRVLGHRGRHGTFIADNV